MRCCWRCCVLGSFLKDPGAWNTVGGRGQEEVPVRLLRKVLARVKWDGPRMDGDCGIHVPPSSLGDPNWSKPHPWHSRLDWTFSVKINASGGQGSQRPWLHLASLHFMLEKVVVF